MALGAGAYLFFACQDASIKYLVTGIGHAPLPVWEVLCARSLFIVIATVASGRGPMLKRAVRTPLKGKLLVRALITLLAWLLYYSASRALPLAQMLTLYFAAPIIATVLAGPLLGERVPGARWLCVLLGFAGVAVACDPGRVGLSWATVSVLLAACAWGVAIIMMRQIARQESTALQMFYTNAVFLVATTVGVLVRSRALDAGQVLLLALVCVLGAVGQVLLFEGARRAPASIMATVEYTALIWAFILGYVVFRDTPNLAVFLGAGMILGAGALLVASERRRRGLVRG
jgi:drug/metabolite transporter (DMT)-like permease